MHHAAATGRDPPSATTSLGTRHRTGTCAAERGPPPPAPAGPEVGCPIRPRAPGSGPGPPPAPEVRTWRVRRSRDPACRAPSPAGQCLWWAPGPWPRSERVRGELGGGSRSPRASGGAVSGPGPGRWPGVLAAGGGLRGGGARWPQGSGGACPGRLVPGTRVISPRGQRKRVEAPQGRGLVMARNGLRLCAVNPLFLANV